MKRTIAVVVLLGAFAPAATEAAPPKLIPYTVQPGETCLGIAESLLGDPKLHTLIHRYNDLGPMPHLLEPGQQLMLPADRVRPEARVEELRNDVKARAPRTVNWQRARDRMTLWQMYRVATGGDSSAGIEFRDASRIRMREDALLVIYGGAAGKAQVTEAPRTDVQLEKGTIVGGLARLDAAADMKVRTPSGEVDLRATEAQVEVTEAQDSVVSVWTGQAKVRAEGTEVTVPEAHGTTVKKGAPPKPPRPLPPPVRWAEGVADAVIVVPPGTPGTFRAAWDPVDRAARYRVEVLRDVPGRPMVADVVVGAGLREFEGRDLPPGDYTVRVSAIDDTRLQGKPSRPLSFRVVPVQPSRPLEPGPDGTVQAAGFLALALPEDAAGQVDVRVDGAPPVPGTTPIRLDQPGPYRISYVRRDGGGSSTLVVRLLAVRGRIEVPQGAIRPGPDGPEAAVVVADELGRNAALPGMVLVARPGGFLDTRLDASGRYVADLAPLEGMAPGSLELSAEWALGVLDQRSIKIAPPPTSPGPRPFAWTWAPPAPSFAGGGIDLPARAPRPVSRVGLAVDVTGPSRGDTTRVASVVEGELALLDGRLGLDVAFPWLDVPWAAGSLNRSSLGDLRVGVRGVAASGERWAVVPSLRVVAPTSEGADRTVIEPALLLEWRPVGPLFLCTSQAFPIDVTRDDAALRWTSHWVPGIRLWDRLDLMVDVAFHLGLHRPENRIPSHATAVGGGLRLLLGRARLGIHASGGVDRGGRDHLGRFTAGLTLEVGFRGF
jgi:hypothetical protein